MGYDFHLSAAGPRLIEINTNAGGAMLATATLAAATARASACSPAQPDNAEQVQENIVQMLLTEWRRGRSLQRAQETAPRTIAIVDTHPTEQYLYPDTLLIARLLDQHNIHCVIVDPAELSIDNEQLCANGVPVDLVYNRLTDFYFAEPAHQVLKHAHKRGLAVISPAPEHHACYADKRNLALLATAPLAEWGASAAQIDALAELPLTTSVTDDTAAQLWTDRKTLFFKPHGGYGSRAVYRGSKITRKVWQHVLTTEYLAQQLVEPGRRATPLERALKFDLRLYTYRTKTLLTTARLYRGQTTNFRTQGGGFAPVVRLP